MILFLKSLLFVREIKATFRRSLHSSISLASFLAVSVGVWGGSRWLIGLAYQMIGIGPLIIDRLLYLAFLTLFGGLTLSAATVGYFLLYRSNEVRQWVNWPISSRRVVLWKGLETWVLSSWAFLLVGMIFMVAYGQEGELPPQFLVRCLIYFIPFSALTAALGLWGALLWARFVTNRTRALLIVGLILAGIVGLLTGRSSKSTGSSSPLMISQWIPYFQIYSSPWLPSSWLTQGILSFKVPGERGAVLHLALLCSNALLAWDLLGWVSRRWYLISWDRQISFPLRPVYVPGKTFWDRIGRLLGWFPSLVSTLALKELKGFWRDPAQWPQGVITFGILGVYFVNLRSFAYDLGVPEWKVLIAFLNFMGLALSLVSLNVRFLFPQMSLELRQIWTLGLAPLSLPRVFRIKCLVYATTSFLVVGGLLVLSNWMLRLEAGLSLYLFLLMAFLVFPLVTIPMGMGACFPQVREDNPLRIVSGIGGSLAFSSCLFEVLLILGLVAWPIVQAAQGRIALVQLWPFLGWVGAAAVLLCMITGWIALSLGIKSLQNVEPLLAV